MVSSIAVVVAAPSDLLARGLQWSAAGLVPGLAWLDQAQFTGLTGMAAQQTAACTVWRNGQSESLRLTEYLAEVAGLSEVRAAWIRSFGDLSEQTAMGQFGDFLRRHVIGTQCHFVDIAPPAEAGENQWPLTSQDWRCIVVSPQDRPDPSSSDSGWSPRREAVTLHTTFAVLGVLGGEGPMVPFSSDVTEIHAFSRLVGGGELAAAEAVLHLDRVLPEAAADTVHPQGFELFEAPGSEVERAAAWLTDAADGALAYAAPSPSVLPSRPQVSWRILWRTIVACAGFVLGGVFGKALSADRALNRLAGRAADVPVPRRTSTTSAAAEFTDWEGLDALQRDDLRTWINEARHKDGQRPDPGLWRSLLQLATGLVDGGPLPIDYPASGYSGERLVVTPDWIGPAPQPTDPSTSASATGTGTANVAQQWRELRAEDSPLVLAAAIHAAQVSLGSTPAPLVEPEMGASPGSRTVTTWAAQMDARTRETQAGELHGIPDATPPTTFVDRLRAISLGALLRARLDGDRWAELALADLPRPGDALRKVLRQAQWIARATLAGTLVTLGLWWMVGDDVQDWLKQTFDKDLQDRDVLLGIAVLCLALLTWAVMSVVRAFLADLDLGRRRCESRDLLARRAVDAYRQHRTLEHGTRILRLWAALIGALYPRSQPSIPEAQPGGMPPLPWACEWREPKVDRRWLSTHVVAPIAAPVGWRSIALIGLAREALAGPSRVTSTESDEALLASLCADPGLPGHPLAEVAGQLDGGEPWARWRAKEIARIAALSKSELVGPRNKLQEAEPAQGRLAGTHDGPLSVQAFLDEVTGRLQTSTRRLAGVAASHEVSHLLIGPVTVARSVGLSSRDDSQVSTAALADRITAGAVRTVQWRYDGSGGTVGDKDNGEPERVIRSKW